MKNLYVGNLPHSTTEAELRNLFEAHGAVEKITLVTDRDTGRSRGFGFVEMSSASEADKALAALNGSDLGGRTLTINEAKPKTERPRGGGHRYGVEAAVGVTTIAAIHGRCGCLVGSIWSERPESMFRLNRPFPSMSLIAPNSRFAIFRSSAGAVN